MIYLIESHNLLSAKNWGNWTSYLVLRREGREAARGGGGVVLAAMWKERGRNKLKFTSIEAKKIPVKNTSCTSRHK